MKKTTTSAAEQAIPPWLQTLFADVDRAGVEGIWETLDDDVVFRFGSFPAGRGRAAFNDAWRAMSPAVRSLSHQLIAAWALGETVICRGNVTYCTVAGQRVSVPFANFFKLGDGRITEYLIHVDASAVFGIPPT